MRFLCTMVICLTGFLLCENASVQGRPSSVALNCRAVCVLFSKPTAAGEVWHWSAGFSCQENPARVWWYAVHLETWFRQTRKLQQKLPFLISSLDNIQICPCSGSRPVGHPRGMLFSSLRLFLWRVLVLSEGRLLAPSHIGFRRRKRNRYSKFC